MMAGIETLGVVVLIAIVSGVFIIVIAPPVLLLHEIYTKRTFNDGLSYTEKAKGVALYLSDRIEYTNDKALTAKIIVGWTTGCVLLYFLVVGVLATFGVM